MSHRYNGVVAKTAKKKKYSCSQREFCQKTLKCGTTYMSKNTTENQVELTVNSNIATTANSSSSLKPVENPQWSEKPPFEDIPENLRNEVIRKYNRYEKLLNEINSRFFVSYIGGKSLIFRIPENPNGELQSFSHHEFKNHYGNKSISVVTDIAKGKVCEKEVHYFYAWLKHKNRKQYNLGIRFYPGQVSEQEAKSYYNSWRGFPIEGKNGEFPKIEYHLKHVWCRDNIDHYNYLMSWFADIIQNPAKKKGTALVVKGIKGSGKSIIVENLLYKIFGYTYIKVDKPEQVTGKFNLHLQGKLLLVLEEAIWAGDKTAEGALKSMITDTQFVIEGKGTNAEKSEAFFRMIFLSNEKQAVPATKDERRFFALKVSDEYCRNTKYFAELDHEIENGGAEAFMYHLQNLDISNINLRNAPKTEALFDDILAKMETVERFLYDLLHEDYAECKNDINLALWGNKVRKASLYEAFEIWEKKIQQKNVYFSKHDITSQTGLIREINKLMSFKDTKIEKVNGYIFPSKEDARKMFESKMNCQVEWKDDPSDDMVDIDYELMNTEMNDIIDEDMRQRKAELESTKSSGNTSLGKFFAK
jgi:hypothetical protein